tara:strand:+ start:4322 stop:5209 length:888 start_codon:yes stop_codon:yes gene_type:complete
MKHLILLPFLLFYLSTSAQGDYSCNFENSCGDQSQDTLSNPNNIWEVGIPNKTVFDTAYSGTNSMITDLDSPYPVNDTSYFILEYQAGYGFSHWQNVDLHGYYWVNSDSLNDYGTIEISVDQGASWIDLLNDTVYIFENYWFGQKPVLTGNSGGWKEFDFRSSGFSINFNVDFGDTVMYRFGFISDGQSDTLDGLMFDKIRMMDWAMSVPEYSMGSFKSTVYPNPTSNKVSISFSNPQHQETSCAIFDAYGRIVKGPKTTKTESLHFDLHDMESGIYYYHVKMGEEISKGKIVKR